MLLLVALVVCFLMFDIFLFWQFDSSCFVRFGMFEFLVCLNIC